MSLPRARSGRSKTLNLACCLLVGALCGLALFNGSKWLLAEHYRNVAGELVVDWKAGGSVSLDDWTRAHAAMEQAVALHDARANLHYTLGYLYEWRLLAPYAIDEQLPAGARELAQYQAMAADLAQADAAYRASLARGPSMAETWARLASVRQMSGNFDATFVAAYANAYLYGRNISGLHSSLTDLSLRFFAQIRRNTDIASFQAAHLRDVLGRRSARQHVQLMTQYGTC